MVGLFRFTVASGEEVQREHISALLGSVGAEAATEMPTTTCSLLFSSLSMLLALAKPLLLVVDDGGTGDFDRGLLLPLAPPFCCFACSSGSHSKTELPEERDRCKGMREGVESAVAPAEDKGPTLGFTCSSATPASALDAAALTFSSSPSEILPEAKISFDEADVGGTEASAGVSPGLAAPQASHLRFLDGLHKVHVAQYQLGPGPRCFFRRLVVVVAVVVSSVAVAVELSKAAAVDPSPASGKEDAVPLA